MTDQLFREPPGTPGHLIKSMDPETVKLIGQEFDLVTPPDLHQIHAIMLGVEHDTFLFAYDMGLGKTKIALDILTVRKRLAEAGQCESPKQMLVTCPPIVMHSWLRQVGEHSKLSGACIEGYAGQKVDQLVMYDEDVIICSHPWLRGLLKKGLDDPALGEELDLLIKKFNMLTIDEVHTLANPTSVGFHGYERFLLDVKYRYLLTGTPVGNDQLKLFGLYYLMDKGSTFGEFYRDFLREYFTTFYVKHRFPKYTLRPDKKAELESKLWTKCVRYEEGECSDLPDKVYTTFDFDMYPKQTAMYDGFIADLEEEDRTQAVTEMTMADLMRITAGINVPGGSPKLEALKTIITDVCIENKHAKKQILVWHWLVDEGRMLEKELGKAFPKLRIGSVRAEVKDKLGVLERWRAGKIDILIGNMKSLGIGVDLYEANVCVFFSNNLSLIDRKQTEKRIHRKGQTERCVIIDLVCRQTVDELNRIRVMKANKMFDNLMKDRGGGIKLEEIMKQRKA